MNKTAYEKLKMDIQAYCHDNALQGRFAAYKLLVVVDFWPVFYYRLLEFCREQDTAFRLILKRLLVVFKPLVNGLSGARISPDAIIGGGFLLHQSVGVVIAAGSVIGENCTFFSGSCVVYKANRQGNASPVIGDNVSLMLGSKVLGSVKIGDNVIIGANAVVLKDVPENSMAVGVPARVIDI